MYMQLDNRKKELNIMKVFNLYPLLFGNIMTLFIPLLMPVKIILYLDLKNLPLLSLSMRRTLWSVESRIALGERFCLQSSRRKGL